MVGISQLNEYHQAYKSALEILQNWDEEDEPSLLRRFEFFANRIKPLVDTTDPGWDNCRALGRHMTFMERYLRRGEKVFSKSDAIDIVYRDLPSFADFLLLQASTPDHLDARLAQATSRLFEIEDYASVIRATFPVLSSRLRRIFGIPDGTDGENLVNDIFTKGLGSNPVVLPQDEKTAYRNLVAGFYASYRNKLNHGDYQPTFSQARGVVEMANTLIKDLELLAETSLTANAQTPAQ
ncbi:TIGR02391 family protein [Pseudomonas sp. B21-015]|uniref:TIGR02391 family protein n=1 Tax=Pseudomonas sp. B21-015 TaxID=2895473 RepID=UPI00215F5177|nr:TIGR02391 family protein [Pseudomonas sp. B21-015]UVM48542.1 TIGR02391 family protein [Pseudomonas sp. B21-015]